MGYTMLCVLVFILHILKAVKVESACDRVEGTKRCCTGFIWNDTIGDCSTESPDSHHVLLRIVANQNSLTSQACPLGYVGLKCEIPCTYPLYGLECQSVCDCSRELCLIATGCIQTTTATGKTTNFAETDITGKSGHLMSTSKIHFTFVTTIAVQTVVTITPSLGRALHLSLSTEALIIIACLVGIALLLVHILCHQCRKRVALRDPIERNYVTTCSANLNRETGRISSEDCITEINNVTLTIVKKNRDCVIQLEPSACYESIHTKHRQTEKDAHVSSVIEKKVGSVVSLESVDSGGYVMPNNKNISTNEVEQNVYVTVIESQ